MLLDIVIPGEPIGKARPRVTVHGTFTPKRTRDAEKVVAECAWAALGGGYQPTDELVSLTIWFYCGTKRGDIDNKVKLIQDALNKIVYVDDRQIRKISAEVVSVRDDRPRTHVYIDYYRGIEE